MSLMLTSGPAQILLLLGPLLLNPEKTNMLDASIRACSDPELTDITTAAPLDVREDITDSEDLLQVVLL